MKLVGDTITDVGFEVEVVECSRQKNVRLLLNKFVLRSDETKSVGWLFKN